MEPSNSQDGNLKNWKTGWWDFYPLLERPKRPLQWSSSSIIFGAHSTQPQVTGRHFPSSKQFVLPSPALIVASPALYDPPSVICVTSNALWLFAYFPKRDGEGIGCLWKSGSQLDSWAVHNFWTFPKNGGVIAASWFGSYRQWVTNSSGSPIRLPTRGPRNPVSEATLLLVTQDHFVQLTYVRQYATGLRTIKRHLAFPGITIEDPSPQDGRESVEGTHILVDAAIGMGFNDTSVFIATRSRRIPPPAAIPTTTVPPFNSMDLSVSVDSTYLNAPDQKPTEWENWGEDRMVELSEILVRFDGVFLGLAVNPISSVECTGFLTSFDFVCALPAAINAPQPDSSASQAKRSTSGKMFFVTTVMNFNDYAKQPTSTLTSYSFPFKGMTNGRPLWSVQQEAILKINSAVVTHIEPFIHMSGQNTGFLYITALDTSGSVSSHHSKVKEVPIGTVNVLNIPDLSENKYWEPAIIKSSVDSLCRNLPLVATASPNHQLLCTLSSSLWHSQLAIYSLPKAQLNNSDCPPLALDLVSAILGHRSTTDVIHSICGAGVSHSEATDILYRTIEVLDNYRTTDLSYPSTMDVIGVAIEVYRMKASISKSGEAAELLRDRWETGHDICSMEAANNAFASCKEENGYDLDAVWQLIGLSTWVINFTEKLMKACVTVISTVIDCNRTEQLDSVVSTMPIFLHLTHPLTLSNLVTALKLVKGFRIFLGSLQAGSEFAQIAQSVLVDAVDCSGIDLSGLITVLEENLESIVQLDSQECRKALTACQSTGVMTPSLGVLLRKISQSEALLNKSTLFIKPYDFVDGVANLSLSTEQPENNERDVISKALFLKKRPTEVCVRCGGKTILQKSEPIIRAKVPSRWALWGMMWHLHCICGGPWLSAAVN